MPSPKGKGKGAKQQVEWYKTIIPHPVKGLVSSFPLKMLLHLTTILILLFSKGFADVPINNPGYRYSYYVRDVKTGDYKTQEETRDGDTVRGSYTVGEPNGDLRVVTYHAGKDTGFNAHVQVQPGGVQMFNDAYKQQQTLSSMMRSVPRNQQRTGFPQVEIKVVPPLGITVQNTAPVEENLDKFPLKTSLEESTQEIVHNQQVFKEEVQNETTNESLSVEQTTVGKEPEATETTTITAKEGSDDVLPENNDDEKLKKESNEYKEHLCQMICKQKTEEEGRAHIKPNEDKVQVEMEQIIRAEMQEPTAINLGIPYEQYPPTEQQTPHYQIRPTQTDFKPQTSQEVPKEHFLPPKPMNPIQLLPPSYYQSKVFLLPFNINSNDYLTLKNPTINSQSQVLRDEQNAKKLFPGAQFSKIQQNPSYGFTPQNTNQQQTKVAHVYPMYTTGLAFIVMPRM